MLNTKLLARPFSSDRPRIEGFEPIITCKITRISRSSRNSWRAETLVDDCPMCMSHHDTKAAAESRCEDMIKAYAEAHYIQV
jgi:hypothetical protein